MVTLHVVVPAPANLTASTARVGDRRFSVETDHGVLVVRTLDGSGRSGRHEESTGPSAGIRVSEDLHVPDDLDPSIAVVTCHDGLLDIRIPMGAPLATTAQPAPTPSTVT